MIGEMMIKGEKIITDTEANAYPQNIARLKRGFGGMKMGITILFFFFFFFVGGKMIHSGYRTQKCI